MTTPKTTLITFRQEKELYNRFKEKFPPFILSQFLRKCMEKAVNEKYFLTNILYKEQNNQL